MKKLGWHRIYNSADGPDYVSDGLSRNYLAVKYPYGWELFFLSHGHRHPTVVNSAPFARLKDAKAFAQEMEKP